MRLVSKKYKCKLRKFLQLFATSRLINFEFFQLLGFKDLLKIGESIACFNLKCTYKKALNEYPSLLATTLSLFTQKVNRHRFMHPMLVELEKNVKSFEVVIYPSRLELHNY
jgi:hypothetical protein